MDPSAAAEAVEEARATLRVKEELADSADRVQEERARAAAAALEVQPALYPETPARAGDGSAIVVHVVDPLVSTMFSTWCWICRRMQRAHEHGLAARPSSRPLPTKPTTRDAALARRRTCMLSARSARCVLHSPFAAAQE